MSSHRSSYNPYPTPRRQHGERPEPNPNPESAPEPPGRVPDSFRRKLASVSAEDREFLAQERNQALNRCHEITYDLHHVYHVPPERIQTMARQIPGIPMSDSVYVPEEGVVSYVRRCKASIPPRLSTVEEHVHNLAASWSIVAAISEWLLLVPWKIADDFDKRCTEIELLDNEKRAARTHARREEQPQVSHPRFPTPTIPGHKVPRGMFDPFRRPFELVGEIFSLKSDNNLMYFKVTGFEELLSGETQFKLWYDIVPDPVEAPAKEVQLILSDEELVHYPRR